jgi:hypothetical protein
MLKYSPHLEAQYPQLLQLLDLDKLLKRYESIKTNRGSWESKWRQIQQLTDPTTDPMPGGISSHRHGTNDNFKVFSSDVNSRLDKVVSRFFINLTDPSAKWFSMELVSSQLVQGLPISLKSFDVVSDWLGMVSDAFFHMTTDSSTNFYAASYNIDENCFRYGNGCMEIIRRGDKDNIRFNSVNIFDVYPSLNGYGEIETIYRKLPLSIVQAYDIWGEKLNEHEVSRLRASNAQDVDVDMLDVSMPNPLYGSVPGNLPWLDLVVDVRNRYLVDIESHHFPKYQYIRFKKHDGEVYGKSPLWIAMPDALVVNNLNERLLQAADYSILPPIVVKDENSIPGGKFITPMSYVQGMNINGQVEVQPLQFVTAQALQPIIQFMEMKLNSLDHTLSAMDEFIDSGTMTAREVTARQVALMTRFRPFLVMLEQDFLQPVITKSLSILSDLGRLPEFPYAALAEEMTKAKYFNKEWFPEDLQFLMPSPFNDVRITFCGKMAKMALINNLADYQLILDECMKLAQLPDQQSALLTFNGEGYLRELAEVYSDNNPIIVNSRDKVMRVIEARMEAEKEQMNLQSQMADNQIMVERLNALAKIPPETMAQVDKILEAA